jgi:hypothetical protein
VCLVDVFANGDDFSWSTMHRRRNEYYQRQVADEIGRSLYRVMSLLTSSSSIHVNVGQNVTFNTSSIVMSMGRLSSLSDLSNARLQGGFHFASSMSSPQDSGVLFRVSDE